MSSVIAHHQLTSFHDEGYCILEGVIDQETLTMLREECAYFVGYTDGSMDQEGVGTRGITHRGSRYFIGNRYRMSGRLHRFLFGALMAEVATTLLGDDVYLFNEQWVVKGAEQGMKFSWHQDSGYVMYRDATAVHRPYLSCWCTLDDVSEANGTVYVLPHSAGNTRDRVVEHVRQEGSNDLVGFDDSQPGVPVVAPAGSIACFTSFNLHKSGANRTEAMRRVYLAQYSNEPIHSGSGELWAMAVPFVSHGANVYDHDADTAEHHGPRR